MASVSTTFTQANTLSAPLLLAAGETLTIAVTRTGSGDFAVQLEERIGGDTHAPVGTAITADTAATTYANAKPEARWFRLRCASMAGGDSIATTLADVAGEPQPGAEWFDQAGTRVFAVTDRGATGNLVGDVTGDVTGDSTGTHTGAVIPASGLLTPGTGVTANEQGALGIRQAVLTLTDVVLPIVSVTTGNGVGGVTIATLPEGYIYTLGCVAALTWSIPSADQADYTDGTPEGDMGIGTLAPANADALGTDATDDSLATAAAITGTAFAGAVNLASEAPLAYDGSETAMPIVLTGLIDAADIDDDVSSTILVSGTVTLTYIHRGDVTAP